MLISKGWFVGIDVNPPYYHTPHSHSRLPALHTVYIYLLTAYVPGPGDEIRLSAFRVDKTTLLRRFLSCKAVQNEHEIAKIRNVLPGVS